MNRCGQEFSGFRLLIDAILVLMILVVIMGILGWVEGLRFQMSEQRLSDGFSKAVNSPNGKIVLEKNLSLRAGLSYIAGGFADRASLEKQCVKFDALDVRAFALSSNQSQIDITNNMVVDMYYRCIRNLEGDKCDAACDICCEISFGKELFNTP